MDRRTAGDYMKKRYTITLSDDVVKEAKKMCIDEDISFSALIEKLLVEYCGTGLEGE